MLSLFIMLFIAIGIAAGIGYAIVTLINTAQISLTVQQNQVRLQNISTAIRAGLTTDRDSVLLPIGAEKDGVYYARLPASSPFNTTSSGSPIVYCPAFPSEGTGETLINSQGTIDEAIDIDISTVGDRKYISAGHAADLNATTLSRLNKMGVVAYLLSPQPHYKGPLLCGNVTVSDQDNYTLVIDGGSAVPIYSVTTDGRGSVFDLSDTPLAPAYNGTDRVVNTLGDVGDFMTRYQIADVTVKLPETFNVEYSELRKFLDAGTAKTIRLIPSGENARSKLNITTDDITAEDRTESPATIFVEAKGTLVLKDLDVVSPSDDVVLEAGAVASITLVDSKVAGLRASGGRISAIESTQIVRDHDKSSTLPLVSASGGNITISSDAEPAVDGSEAALHGVFQADGGTISLESGVKVAANPLFPELHQLFALKNGGRIVVSGENPALDIKKGTGGYISEPASFATIIRQTVETVCVDGSTECEVFCPSTKTVDFGFCSSDNGAAVSAFRPIPDADGALTSFACTFGGTVGARNPTASAVCSFPN